jgi:ribosomal protein S18 acetylase RimI-like enzyme
VEGARVVGRIDFGVIAGAQGAGRLQAITVDAASRRRGVARALVDAAVATLRDEGCRFVAVEIPDDPAAAPARALLADRDFRVEASVAGYFREGVAMLILRRDLDSR